MRPPTPEISLKLLICVCAVLCTLSATAQDGRTKQGSQITSSVVAGTNSMEVLDDQRKLLSGDRLSYRVVEERTEPRPIFVTDSREVEIPLIGRVRTEGKTCKTLAQDIKKELEKDYFHKATVILGLDAASGRSAGRIYLMGEIKTQGSMEIPPTPNFTVTKAILQAGGFGDFANQKKVKVVRKSPETKGSDTMIVDVASVLKGNTEKDILLEPDDVIIVSARAVNF